MIFMMIVNMAVGLIVIYIGVKGLNFFVVIVCVFGFNVIGDVFCLI